MIFFRADKKNSSALFGAIEEACQGLIYTSETDAPLVAFQNETVGPLTKEHLLRLIKREQDTPVEERSFADLFVRLTRIQDWFGELELARAKKFLELQRLLEENLSDLKVFRIGQVQIHIYVVGLDTDRRLLGFTTQVVET